MQPAERIIFFNTNPQFSHFFVTNSADIDPLQGHARAAAAREILANAPTVALPNRQIALAPPRGPVGAFALLGGVVEVEKLIVGRKNGLQPRQLRERLEGGRFVCLVRLVKGLIRERVRE